MTESTTFIRAFAALQVAFAVGCGAEAGEACTVASDCQDGLVCLGEVTGVIVCVQAPCPQPRCWGAQCHPTCTRPDVP